MSTGKQSKFLTIYFSALVAGGLVLGYLAWSASSKAEEAEAEYKKAERDLDALEGAKLSRTEENAKKKKALVAEYVTKVQALNSDLMKYQAPLNAAETNTSFQTKLQAATDAARATAKDKQVKLDEKFDLGMGKFLSVFPVAGTAPRLAAQLDGIIFLANAAMDAGVTQIDSLTRTELPFEKGAVEEAPKPGEKPKRAPAAAAKPATAAKTPAAPVSLVDESKVLERQPLTLKVTGKNRSILALLEALANTSPEKDSPHFFIIRTLKIENEKKDGPPKTLIVTPEEVTPDQNDKSSVFLRDAMYLLGNEQVKMQLDLDLIRFVSEADAAATKPAPARPASASAASAR